MIRGSCHCGAVAFELQTQPEWLTSCNCSMCRRIGGLWAHADPSLITIQSTEGATLAYAWGDRDIAFHSCRTCGSTTHWENLRPERYSRMAVNCSMVDPADIADIPVRRFDGADTWRYLDPEP